MVAIIHMMMTRFHTTTLYHPHAISDTLPFEFINLYTLLLVTKQLNTYICVYVCFLSFAKFGSCLF